MRDPPRDASPSRLTRGREAQREPERQGALPFQRRHAAEPWQGPRGKPAQAATLSARGALVRSLRRRLLRPRRGGAAGKATRAQGVHAAPSQGSSVLAWPLPLRQPRAHPSLRGAQYRDQGVTLQLVQERSGNYKPLYRAFPRKDGLSTVPILMQGHPDDVKGGRLISSEVRRVIPHYHTHHSTRSDWWTGPGP